MNPASTEFVPNSDFKPDQSNRGRGRGGRGNNRGDRVDRGD